MIILTDADLDRLASMPEALRAIESALLAKARDTLVAPPRHRVLFPGFGSLFFTIGGETADEKVAGFRVYDTFDGPSHTQLTAVWDVQTAALLGLVIGERLGEIRTGAIGGIAIREMSAPDASSIGIIGSGQQACTQLHAAAAVRPLTSAKVFSRNPANRETFAAEMQQLLSLAIEAVSSPEAAVRDADIVICATSSETPVLDARWLKPGAHVNTVGPKTLTAHEIGVDVAQLAAIIATDSLAQTRAYTTPFFLDGTPHADRMIELSAIVGGKAIGRASPSDVTLFCSTGLAGTEVLVASRLLALAASHGASVGFGSGRVENGWGREPERSVL